MQYKHNLVCVTIGIGLIICTTQWPYVISASVSNDENATRSQGSQQTNQNELDNKINGEDSNELFYSDELNSDEYADDLDANLSEQRRREHQQQNNHDWDVIIFTQQWPATSCYHWREEDKKNTCSLPSKKDLWTIHGIWPTVTGHFGPEFCNKSAAFNVTVLDEIMDPLRQYWPTIKGGPKDESDDFWKHEWLKHGTCAAAVKALDNELKYFEQGLVWRRDYLLSEILSNAGIHPDSNNTVIALQTALVKSLGKNPSIHCVYDNKNEISYLLEIRICFDKSLQLTDCDNIMFDSVSIDYPGGNMNTNCHVSKPVHYPSSVPPVQHRKQDSEWKFPVVNIYKLLQFIMWFTL